MGSVAKSQKPPFRIWDIGTGSGCIAIALAKQFPDAEVIAFDVSDEALQIAKENAESNGAKMTFVHDDVMNPQSDYFNQPVDLVVSNRPMFATANAQPWKPTSSIGNPKPHCLSPTTTRYGFIARYWN